MEFTGWRGSVAGLSCFRMSYMRHVEFYRSSGRAAALTAAAVCGMLAVIGLPPSVARAASGDYGQMNRSMQVRQCADTRCGAATNVSGGQWVPLYCWRDQGADLGTNRWFRVGANGTQGYVSANSVSNPQPSVPRCSNLIPNDRIFASQQIQSDDGRFTLAMQGDGNLVEYGPEGAYWSTMTSGTSGSVFIQQGDGNGVLYGSNGPLWANMTMSAGSILVVQTDANIVTYYGNTPLYATNQHRWASQQLLASGARNPGASGNCTWWAEEQIKNFMKRGHYPAWGGNAKDWNDNAPAYGWPVQGMPTSHAIVVFEAGVAGAASLGHVAWVDQVQVRGSAVWVHVSEMNFVGYGKVSERWVQHQAGMSYIPAPSL